MFWKNPFKKTDLMEDIIKGFARGEELLKIFQEKEINVKGSVILRKIFDAISWEEVLKDKWLSEDGYKPLLRHYLDGKIEDQAEAVGEIQRFCTQRLLINKKFDPKCEMLMFNFYKSEIIDEEALYYWRDKLPNVMRKNEFTETLSDLFFWFENVESEAG
jgi:hypothetical protein